MQRSTLLASGLGLVVAGLLLCGCRNEKTEAGVLEPPPPYEQVVAQYNARTARLPRMWARAVVSIRYIDVDDDRRYEQGDGHLQRLDAEKIALSVGKLGETLFWFGADEQRYWLFDLTSEHTVAYVGRHDLLTPDKARRAGLPVPPHQFLSLAGLSPMTPNPEQSTVERTSGGDLRVTINDRGVLWRYTLDPTTLYPSGVELLGESGRPVLISELSQYKTVDLTGEGFDEPRAPGRIHVRHPESETEITVTIDGDIIDGVRAGKPRPQSFDFDVLVRALAPDEVIDLDQPAEVSQAP